MRSENPDAASENTPLIDPFGRTVSYVRMSVTDRCDFRCVYCMSENMTFLPKADLLTLEELERVARVFSGRGVRRIRITGGEPLVRRDVMQLMRGLGELVREGALDEWTLTTNASQLGRFADQLKEAGLRRVNISLDTRDAEKFRAITRWGRLEQVLAGIEAARQAGLHIKVNMVALKGVNDGEIGDMLAWCGEKGLDMCLIETMPIGAVDGGRADTFLSLAQVREELAKCWTFEDSDYVTPGPARYVRVRETGTRLGFITPLSHNFCEGCNRIRMTCTGCLYMCLGQEDSADLRGPLRADPTNGALHAAITEAISRKPKGHDFVIERDRSAAAVARHMNVTGG